MYLQLLWPQAFLEDCLLKKANMFLIQILSVLLIFKSALIYGQDDSEEDRECKLKKTLKCIQDVCLIIIFFALQ